MPSPNLEAVAMTQISYSNLRKVVRTIVAQPAHYRERELDVENTF
jgi:hypothetical protein